MNNSISPKYDFLQRIGFFSVPLKTNKQTNKTDILINERKIQKGRVTRNLHILLSHPQAQKLALF